MVCIDSTEHLSNIQSRKSCGQCLGVERNAEAFFETKTSGKPTLNLSEMECLTYATLIGENTTFQAKDNAPAEPAGCVVKPDKSIVYFNKNTDGESTVVECGNNQYNLECVNAKDNVVLSNLSDEDSCRIGKGVWEQFEWRQTPNVNEALTCFEGCGGWCVRDDGKTEEISEKRCTITGENCNNDTDCACDHPRFPKKRAYSSRPGNSTLGRTRRSLPVRGTIDRRDARSKRTLLYTSTATLALRGMTNTSPWNTQPPRATRLANQQSQRARHFPAP